MKKNVNNWRDKQRYHISRNLVFGIDFFETEKWQEQRDQFFKGRKTVNLLKDDLSWYRDLTIKAIDPTPLEANIRNERVANLQVEFYVKPDDNKNIMKMFV